MWTPLLMLVCVLMLLFVQSVLLRFDNCIQSGNTVGCVDCVCVGVCVDMLDIAVNREL